jgi:hypothetical protein
VLLPSSGYFAGYWVPTFATVMIKSGDLFTSKEWKAMNLTAPPVTRK